MQRLYLAVGVQLTSRISIGMKVAREVSMLKRNVRAGSYGRGSKLKPFQGAFRLLSSAILGAVICLAGADALGAIHCVSVSGAGTGSGADWNNSYAASGQGSAWNYVRGDSYYYSAGTNAMQTLNVAASGTNVITLLAATTTSHGTNTGWVNSMAGQVCFINTNPSGGGLEIYSPYWTIDGQTRGSDWRSGYGFHIWNQANKTDGACFNLYSGANNITVKNCDIQGTTSITSSLATDGDYGFYGHAQLSNLYVGYCYVHETGNTQFQINYGSSTGFTCEYNYIYKNHTLSNANHDEAFSLTFANSTIRYNILQDIMSSGFICDAAGGVPVISNWEIYGNVFFWDTNYQANPGTFLGDGMIGFFGETYSGHFYFINNTIAGITNTVTQVSSYNSGFYMGSVPSTASSVVIENNIWYNSEYCEDNSYGDYNTYYKSDKANDTGAHSTTSNSNPFVNVNGFNFQLTAATPAGVAFQAPYNMDMLGNTRGADGVWDRGAFEFGGTASTNPPVISGVQAIPVAITSATIVWGTDQQSTSILRYGLNTSYGNSVTNISLTNSHSITISSLTANTTYHYMVMSANAAGYVGNSSDSTFTTLTSDTTPPTVSITAPLPNAVIAGTTTLAANASDNGAVAGVQFLVDGKPVGSSITSAPYSYNWNSTSVTNGSHSIQAMATDAASNVATSTAVNVQIQNIVTNGLVGYWTFDEDSGTQAADSSGFGNTATLNAGASWTTNAVLGASSLVLNSASAASASVPDSPALEISGDLTITMWVKHNSLPATNSWMYYLEKGQNSQENYGFGAYSDTNGTRLFFEFVDGTGTSQYYTQGTGLMLNTTAWRHVAVVFDHTHGQLSFYIKGQLTGSTSVTQSLAVAANPLVIGQQNISGYEFYLNGLVDDLRIYNRALSASEINALSLVGSFMPPPPAMGN